MATGSATKNEININRYYKSNKKDFKEELTH